MPCDDLLLEIQHLGVDLMRKLLVHTRRLLSVSGNEVLCDGLLDLLLDERRHCCRERTSDMIRDIWTEEQPLDFGRKVLARL